MADLASVTATTPLIITAVTVMATVIIQVFPEIHVAEEVWQTILQIDHHLISIPHQTEGDR